MQIELPGAEHGTSFEHDRRHRHLAARHLLIAQFLEGYTTDDNARALIVATMLNGYAKRIPRRSLAHRYLAFLWLAFNDKTGRFKNFLGYNRQWLEEVGSEDSHGRALWALGTVLGNTRDAGPQGRGRQAL